MSQVTVEETSYPQKASNRKKILALGDHPDFSDDLMDYAINLAARLDHELLVLNVDTQWEGARFRREAEAAAKTFGRKARAGGIGCAFVVRQGDLAAAVEEIGREEKRIEFVVADERVDHQAAGQIALPIFNVIGNPLAKNGGTAMTGERPSRKTKLVVSTIGYGCLSVALYAVLFSNLGTVMEYFTRGGAYALLPIGTALIFSFAHGAFASSTYSLLGLEAAKKNVLRQAEQKVLEKKKQARKRPRAYAYVNPFHRI